MALPKLDRLDATVGSNLERLVVGHHRRRLSRQGWAHAFAPPDDGLWCAGEPPPREGNRLEVLIDSEEYLPRLRADIEAATESILLAGWTFTPSFRLGHGSPTLRELLAAAAERIDVRVIAWAGAPLPLFRPSRAHVRSVRDALTKGTRIKIALDSLERPMHCHHEKLAVIDGRIAYVGGIDLTALSGDRFDSSDHPARGAIGWHDVSTRSEGPLVADVADHICMRWREVTGEACDVACDVGHRGDVTAQFVRTVPNSVYRAVPRGDFRIFEAYNRAFRSAQRLIYIESQFLWSPELIAVLADKLRNPPTAEFRMVLLLPAHPKSGGDDTRGQLAVLVDADRDKRLTASTLYQPTRAEQVYIHAKVAIVDDRWLCVGSANLNEHSMFNDTEACVITCDEELARATRLRLWREHLQRDDVDGEPHRVVDDLWKPTCDGPDERLALLPHISRRSGALLGPLDGLLVDG